MVWAEMVMGRNGHGPNWLWAEMTRNRDVVPVGVPVRLYRESGYSDINLYFLDFYNAFKDVRFQ